MKIPGFKDLLAEAGMPISKRKNCIILAALHRATESNRHPCGFKRFVRGDHREDAGLPFPQGTLDSQLVWWIKRRGLGAERVDTGNRAGRWGPQFPGDATGQATLRFGSDAGPVGLDLQVGAPEQLGLEVLGLKSGAEAVRYARRHETGNRCQRLKPT
jgi:hypothetical protein